MKIAFININPIMGTLKNSFGGEVGGEIFYVQTYVKAKNKNSLNTKMFNFNSLYPNASNIYSSVVMEYEPDIIFMFAYFWNITLIKKMSINLKNALLNCSIVIGGLEVSYDSENFLRDCSSCDIVIRGECEIAFEEIINEKLKINCDYKKITGITYRDNNLIIKNKDRQLLDDINILPSPFLSGDVELSQYDGEVAYETVRGCPYKCSYCLLYSKRLDKVRKYDLLRIEAELKLILLSKDVNSIWIVDPTFNFDEHRAIEILKIVEKYNSEMPISFEIKAEILTDNLLEQMKKVNILSLGIGLQSHSKEINNCVNRDSDTNLFETNIKKIKSAIGSTCKIDIDIIYGLPNDTLVNYKRTVDYVLNLDCTIFYQTLRILKGARICDEVDKYGICYDPNAPYNTLYNNSYDPTQIRLTHCVNVGIDFVNKGGIYKEIINLIKFKENCVYSDVLEKIGIYFWKAERHDIFRMGNWIIDDRDDEQVFNDFFNFIYSYIDEKNAGSIDNEIKKKLDTYKTEKGYDKPLEFKHSYFHLSF